MTPGRFAPVTWTWVPTGSEPDVHPLVAVLPPVPEQCAACPMYVLVPSLKMKLAVHWAPSVNVWTPGWTAAVPAGAHAPAVDTPAHRTTTATVRPPASLRAITGVASRVKT